jgi:hypothetical protein
MKRALFACVLLAAATLSRAASPPDGADDRLRYEDASGRTLLKIKARDGGRFRLLDGADRVIGEVKVAEGRVKLKDAADVEIRKIKRKPDGAIEIEDAGGQRLYRLKAGDAGEWKIVTAGDVTVVKCEPKENGYEVRDAAGRTLARVKERDGRLAFESETGDRRAVLKGTSDARHGMWLAAEPLTLGERAALVLYFREIQK